MLDSTIQVCLYYLPTSSSQYPHLVPAKVRRPRKGANFSLSGSSPAPDGDRLASRSRDQGLLSHRETSSTSSTSSPTFTDGSFSKVETDQPSSIARDWKPTHPLLYPVRWPWREAGRLVNTKPARAEGARSAAGPARQQRGGRAREGRVPWLLGSLGPAFPAIGGLGMALPYTTTRYSPRACRDLRSPTASAYVLYYVCMRMLHAARLETSVASSPCRLATIARICRYVLRTYIRSVVCAYTYIQ